MMNVWVKICGVTTPVAAAHACDAGADALGLNFAPRSPRYLDAPAADAILAVMPRSVAAVGVFVGPPQLPAGLRLDAVQSYGAHPSAEQAFPASLLPAFRVTAAADLAAVVAYVAVHRPGRVLIDSYYPGVEGGSGHRAPWDLLEGFDPGVPWVLAGGLTPENVGGAVERLRPWGVDVASGVESAPGVKDPVKVRDFVQAARAAARMLPD